jgi:hypothetical protein
MTPLLAFCVWRGGRGLVSALRGRMAETAAVFYLLPMVVFAWLSFKKVIGLHWVLSFYPFFFAVAGLAVSERGLRRHLRFLGVFTGVHVLLVLAALAVPLRWMQGSKEYPTLVIGLRPQKVLKTLDAFPDMERFGCWGYGCAALLSYHDAQRYFSSFGEGSWHGRQDDIITDFRDWNGRNCLVFARKPRYIALTTPYFDRTEVRELQVEGARYYAVLGYGFRFDVYRRRVLSYVLQQYYPLPAWLPTGRCYFREKYVPGAAAPAKEGA